MVRFWDSSALVPLILEEESSAACRRLLRRRADIAVWALARTEIHSAVWRRIRAGDLVDDDIAKAISRLQGLAGAWTEILDVDLVRDRAERLLGVHSLRAADALQLGAALVLVGDRSRNRDFISLDQDLARAASAEGFTVLSPR